MMLARIPTIGRCIGCNRSAQLDRGACDQCIEHDGKVWGGQLSWNMGAEKRALLPPVRLSDQDESPVE